MLHKKGPQIIKTFARIADCDCLVVLPTIRIRNKVSYGFYFSIIIGNLPIFADTRKPTIMKTKRILIIATALLSAILSLTGCSKSEEQNNDVKNTDEYYVKYVFTHTKYSTYPASFSLTFTDEKFNLRTRAYDKSGEEEIVCGPFKFGDTIKASCSNGGSSLHKVNLDVYVSKNNYPFTLRGSGNSIEFTIDY